MKKIRPRIADAVVTMFLSFQLIFVTLTPANNEVERAVNIIKNLMTNIVVF